MNLGDLLPVFAATDAAATTAERNGRFSEFPDEEPTVKQMNDWLEVELAPGQQNAWRNDAWRVATGADPTQGGSRHGSDGL